MIEAIVDWAAHPAGQQSDQPPDVTETVPADRPALSKVPEPAALYGPEIPEHYNVFVKNVLIDTRTVAVFDTLPDKQAILIYRLREQLPYLKSLAPAQLLGIVNGENSAIIHNRDTHGRYDPGCRPIRVDQLALNARSGGMVLRHAATLIV